jgi:chemotaxis protein histidine kinase CheA
MASVRRLAGLPLTEGWMRDDDDDDEDPDVKIVNADKGQTAFERKNKSHLDDNAEALKKRTAEVKAKAAEKKAEKKAEPKSETPAKDKTEEKSPPAEKAPAKAEPAKEEKKVEAAAEKKRRGKAPDENSKSGQMRTWYNANKPTQRKHFLAHAAKIGMSAAQASTLHAKLNPKSGREVKTDECYVITHPFMPSFMLAENREMNGQMQWIDPASPLDPLVFETAEEAQKVVKYMAEWKGQTSKVTKVVFD